MGCASRREAMLLAAAAAGGLLAGGWAQPGRALAAAAAAEDVAEKAVEEYSQLEASGKFKNAKALEDFRSKLRFRRGIDGRVWLKGSKGEYAVRLDMEVPGAMLFRDGSGYVYALQTEALQQIDLSNDSVVILMFADGEWETSMSPIEYQDEAEKLKTLKMSEQDFRNVVGLINMVMDKREDEEGKQ